VRESAFRPQHIDSCPVGPSGNMLFTLDIS
jgi:hypothetical protein